MALDRLSQFRIRSRCKTALSVPNADSYRRYPVVPSHTIPIARNQNAVSPNEVTFVPSKLSLDSSTAAHYVVAGKCNHRNLASTTDDEYDEVSMPEEHRRALKHNSKNWVKHDDDVDEEEEEDDEEEETDSDGLGSGSRGTSSTQGRLTSILTAASVSPVPKTTAERTTTDSSAGSVTSSSVSQTTKISEKRRPKRGSQCSNMAEPQPSHSFEGKTLEELEGLLRNLQKKQSMKKMAEHENVAPLPEFRNFKRCGGMGDGDSNNNNLSDSKMPDKFSRRNVNKSLGSTSSVLDYTEVDAASGDFYPGFDDSQFGSSIGCPSVRLKMPGGPHPFQRQLLESRLQMKQPKPSKPVLSDFPRPQFFQAPLRRLPTPWHCRPGTPLQKIYGSVVNHMPMDTEAQRRKLIHQAVDNGHIYRRIKKVRSSYSRKDQLTDYKKHEAFIKCRGPVANLRTLEDRSRRRAAGQLFSGRRDEGNCSDRNSNANLDDPSSVFQSNGHDPDLDPSNYDYDDDEFEQLDTQSQRQSESQFTSSVPSK